MTTAGQAGDAAGVPTLSPMQGLRAATSAAHRALDARITMLRPFAEPARYRAFLNAQQAFMREIEPLYHAPELAGLVPGLAARSRLRAVEADCAFAGLGDRLAAVPLAVAREPFAALGCLYVAEGSKLGAAVLLKQAGRIGMTDTAGARHLGAAGRGRARAWRAFCDQVDGSASAPEARAALETGARAAFARFAVLLEAAFAGLAPAAA